MMRMYRLLIRLYPTWFRNEYRDELCRAFEECVRGRSTLAVFLLAVVDVVPNAIAAHWEIIRRGAKSGLIPPAVGGDIRYALRQIARTPLFSGVVIVVLALGIGGNAALMTTLHEYAFSPAPGIAADAHLARLLPVASRGSSSRTGEVRLTSDEIAALRNRREVFTDVAAWQGTTTAADFGPGPEPTLTFYTTGNYFRTLRVPMSVGSAFTDAADEVSPPVVVIAHAVWLNQFGGARDVVGKTVRVMNVPFTIVGVAPPRFVGVDVKHLGRTTIWIPLGARSLIERDTARLSAVARLVAGVRPSDVQQRMTPFAASIARENPESRSRFSIGAERLTGMPSHDSDTRELYAAMFVVVVLIVVITCTNVSALLLGRAVARRQEIAVRLSLGATRVRLMRQMLTESLVYAVIGATFGLLLYALLIKVAYATVPGMIEGIEPHPATFAYAALFAIATTIAFGLAPALHATRADIAAAMKNSGALALRRSRLQAVLVVIQLACSQPVLVVTSLVLVNARRATTGAGIPAVLTMDASMMQDRPAGMYRVGDRTIPDSIAAAQIAMLRLMRQRIEHIQGVQSAAFAVDAGNASIVAQRGGDTPLDARHYQVSTGYFAALGLRVIRGRAIGEEEDRRGSRAVVINQRAAELLSPGQDPVGKRLVLRARGDSDKDVSLDVIGVVAPAPYEDEEPSPRIYAPLSTAPGVLWTRLAVQTRGDPRAVESRVRQAVRDIQPFAAIDHISTLAEQYESRRLETFQSNLGAFIVGAAALMLASLGLYAIIAYAVAQRTREIGIRLAVGATPAAVVRHFFRSGITVSAIGLAIGLPAAVAAIRVAQANVLGLTLRNIAAVAVVVPVLISVAALASWLPARRAARVDPLIALRSE